MNRSTTTPFKKFFALCIILIALIFGASTVFGPVQQANASRHGGLSDQIRALQEESAQYQKEAERLRSEGNNLQAELNAIEADKRSLQTQIDLSQAQYDQLAAQIAETERQLDEQKEVLGDTLANLYVDSSVTPLELIAGSKSIGDFIDKQGYRSSIRNKLSSSIKKIRTLRQQLSDQKAKVEEVLNAQKAQRAALTAKEAQQAALLEKTRGEEARYNQLVADREQQWQEAQRALSSFLNAGTGNLVPTGRVRAGDIIGYVGNTGLSSGSHVHLEIRSGGYAVNPISDIPSNWQWPGTISQYFGESTYFYGPGGHPGLDIAGPTGTPIRAVADGTLYRGCSNDILGTSGNQYGFVARVVQDNGKQAIYGHMNGGGPGCDYNTYYGGL